MPDGDISQTLPKTVPTGIPPTPPAPLPARRPAQLVVLACILFPLGLIDFLNGGDTCWLISVNLLACGLHLSSGVLLFTRRRWVPGYAMVASSMATIIWILIMAMSRTGQRYGHAIHDGLFQARFGDRFRFAIMWECHNAGVALDERDLFDNLLPYWVDTYFARPNYLRLDGIPVLFVYSYYALDRIAAPFGGEDNLARIFDRLRAEAVRRGLPGLLLPFEYREAHADGLRRIRQAGADMAFTYCWHTPQ